MINRKSFKYYLSALASLTVVGQAHAMCPLCTVIVGAGVIAAEDGGVDQTIIGIWVGGLTISLIGWTLKWLHGRKINFKGVEMLTTLIYFLLLPVGLFYMGHYPEKFPSYLRPRINASSTTLWGIDKMILGMIIGAIVFYVAAELYEYVKDKNNNKAHFPFERIVFPVAALAIFSTLFYFVTR